ncbi:MAG: hypothetical protein QOH81_182 [Sphingomonadales bacterium]|jgi:hypothetical protein|nr:hypothetical protein [Sphingomonadales bacterium]
MPDATETDFELVKYERDREHELALNEFTHNLEVEQLKLLILLNGGAAAALLTFAEHSGSTVRWLMLPVVIWLIGLSTGAWATLKMREAQSGFGKFYRHRRNATEVRRLIGRRKLPLDISDKELKDLARYAPEEPAPGATPATQDAALLHDRLADLVFDRARKAAAGIDPLSYVSLGAFVAGALTAAAVIAFVPPHEAARSPTANASAPAR